MSVTEAASNVVRGNNNTIRRSMVMMNQDPQYRMTTATLDSIISVLRLTEKTFKEHPSIDLVGAYAETVDLVSKILVKHEMYELAQMIVEQSEVVKKEVFRPIFNETATGN